MGPEGIKSPSPKGVKSDMSRFIEPPGFISETKSFETYQKDLKRWALLTSVEKEKQALVVLHYLDGRRLGIKEKVDAQIEETKLQEKDGIQTLLKFFEKIYKKDSLADGFDKSLKSCGEARTPRSRSLFLSGTPPTLRLSTWVVHCPIKFSRSNFWMRQT